MRVSLFFTAAFAALMSLQQASAQCANSASLCPTVQATVPTPIYELTFDTDPRLLPGIGVDNAGYGWLATARNDSCAAFHSGMVLLSGSTNDTFSLGPHINLGQTTGPYSVGSALPNQGRLSTSSGSFAQGTRGYSFEVTVRADSEGDRTPWGKIVNLGTTSKIRTDRCNGEWVVGWQGESDEVSMVLCTDNGEDAIPEFIRDAPDNTWMHITSVVQASPNGWSTYSVYYNGQLMGTRENTRPLLDVVRDAAFLGRSTWRDKYFNGTFDHFAIYDIALTPAMVQGIYGARMNGCPITRVAYSNATAATGEVAPVFAAEFTSDITAAPGGPADFSWARQDAEDVPCGASAQHQGLLVLAGDADWTPSITAGPYVNLSASSGENYIGQTLPVFGGITNNEGALGSTAGFTVEVSFKASFQNQASKIFALGNADSVPCQPGDMWAGWKGSDYQLEVKYCGAGSGVTRQLLDRGVPLKLRTWYHLAVSVVAQSNNVATWVVYLNGEVVAVSTAQFLPPAIPRKSNLLGRSLFFGTTDTYFSGVVDKFAVYPRALSQAQVSAKASASGIVSCQQSPNNAYVLPNSSVFFQTSWATDPRTQAGVTYNYNWLQVDINDTQVDQSRHTGMILLGSGAGGRNPGQYINLTASSGPNSMGQAIGWFGGEGTGDYLNSQKGWTFEMVFKILPTGSTTYLNASTGLINRNGQDWAKVYNYADGLKPGDRCENDVIFGFNGGDNWMRFQVCNTVGSEQNVGSVARYPMQVNKWYHSVNTVQLTPTGANVTMYLNGQFIESILMTSYPLFASRKDARIGSSAWSADNFFNGAIESHAIYSQAANQRQVNYLYAQAFKLPLPDVPAVSSSSSSTGASTTSTTGTSTTGTSTGQPTSQSTGMTAESSPVIPDLESSSGLNGAASMTVSVMAVVMMIAAVLTM